MSYNLFHRIDVKKLIVRVNEEKKVLKQTGLTVDGKHYNIEFKGNKFNIYRLRDNFRTGVYLFMHAVSLCILL